MNLEKIIQIGRGEIPADMVLKNGQLVNVVSGEIYTADIAICEDKIAGIGSYHGQKEIDLAGKYIVPGFMDAHMHIESSMVEVPEFAKTVVPLGTTAVIADPHEISNVMGTAGISYVLKSSKYNPLSVYVMLSSCVPATHLETAGAELKAVDLYGLLQDKWVLGLAEVMNYPGLLNRDPDVLDKIRLAGGKQIDGHAPGLSGKDLNGYAAAGIHSDHECATAEEAMEKLRLGMYIMIREGTVARNLQDLLPIINEHTAARCLFCTDDRTPLDLLTRGHINSMVRDAVAWGIEPVTAIRMASLNTARYFGLSHLGAVAPGLMADINIFDNLIDFNPAMVFKNGVKVAEYGELCTPPAERKYFPLRSSVNVKWLYEENFRIPAKEGLAKVIGIHPGQITTTHLKEKPKVINGLVVPDTDRDILKIAVVERHHATGNIGLGLVKGFGLKSGAIASSVAHDSHNLIAVGTNDADLFAAVVQLVRMQGGITAVKDGEVLEALPLPIAGLLSDRPLREVADRLESLKKASKSLGCAVEDPFMLMAFLALTVIPELKISDLGLVDVAQFKVVDIFE
jgi:adenine deaminase